MPDEPKPTSIPATPNAANTMNVLTQMIYTNGQYINMTQSDIQIVFNANGRPSYAIVMSLPVAKNLQRSLLKVLSDYERKTNSIIPDINEITEQLKKT